MGFDVIVRVVTENKNYIIKLAFELHSIDGIQICSKLGLSPDYLNSILILCNTLIDNRR